MLLMCVAAWEERATFPDLEDNHTAATIHPPTFDLNKKHPY
ncbi:MAG: hypothetical protein ACXQTS_04255 [Candidatus Methanospirareceae archaeon]